MKNIAFVHYTAPPIVAGVELVIKDHSILMAEDGFDVKIIAGKGGRFHPKVKVEIILEIDPRNPEYLKIREKLEKGEVPENLARYVNRLYQKLKITLEKTDTLIIHQALTMHFNFALTLALQKIIKESSKMKVIHWTHDATFLDENYAKLFSKYKDQSPWNLIISKIPNVQYVTISQYRQNEIAKLLKINPAEIKVISNGLNLSSFWNLGRQTKKLFNELKLSERDLVGFLPMRIVRRKNIEKAIEITQKINEQKDFLLLITAPVDYQNPDAAEYFNQLTNKVAELKLGDKVIFLSLYKFKNGEQFDIENLKLNEFFFLSDFLLLTSSLEGFGMPLLEAGATKTPIICSDIEPFKEIAGNLAFYFKLNDSAEKIARDIIDLTEKNSPSRFYKKVIKEYSLENIYQTKIKPLLNLNAP